ncbi:MAG: glycosyltransferase [Candidatus Omnitrophica bacterium]|nr:glycosyltransferase [Candidatus Omnitrophota bacterium]
MAKKILLLYITISSGHHKASLAVEKAIKTLSPDTETMSINSFNYTNPILEKIINKTYMGIIRRTPEVWEYLYDNPKVVKNTQNLKAAMHKYNSKKMLSLVNDFKPDVICATQAFPCGITAEIKKSFNVNAALVGVLTDFYPHSYWVYDSVDRYVVASETAKQRLVNDGIPENKIKILGIPIDPKFSQVKSRDIIREKFNLDKNKPVILVMGGGQGLGPIKAIAHVLEKIPIDAQVVIVAGTNVKLYKYLIKKTAGYKKRFIILEYSDAIDELMQAADVIVTKPGGITASEALAKSLPIIIINPIPGQEAKNSKFLIESGAAVKADNQHELSVLLESLLYTPLKLRAMSQAANKISKPNSSMDVANMVLGL